jgi:hypothetical protein
MFEPDSKIWESAPIPPPIFRFVISEELIATPEVVYSPIVLPTFELATNKVEPYTARPTGSNPEISDAFTVSPEVVYSPTTSLLGSETKIFEPDKVMHPRSELGRPVISVGFTLSPEVVYSLMKLLCGGIL